MKMRLIDADDLKNMKFSCCMHDDNYIVYVPMREVMKNIDKAPTIGGWISVKNRMPVETHSLFWPCYGKKEWSKAMWLKQSDKVLVTVAFKNGTRLVTTGETHDGVWNTSISRALVPIVTHWMPMPKPAKEDEDETD